MRAFTTLLLVSAFGMVHLCAQTTIEIDHLNDSSMALMSQHPMLAMDLAERAYLKSKAIGYPGGESDALSRKAYALELIGKPDQSLPLLVEALNIRLTLGDHVRISNAYTNLSNLHLRSGNYAAALEDLRKAYAYDLQSDAETEAAMCQYQMAKVFSYTGQYDSALFYLTQASEVFEVADDSTTMWEIKLERAGILFERDHFPEAIEIAEKAARYFDRNRNLSFLTASEKLLALCYEYSEANDQAAHHYQRAYATSEEFGDLYEMTEISAYYAEFLDSIRSPEAKGWYAHSLELKDSLYDSERMRELAMWQARFRTQEKERELAEVRLQKAESDGRSARMRQWVLALVSLLLLVAGGAGFVVYRNRQREAHRKAKAEILFRKQMLEATVNAQEEERQRIAKDLHDGLVQTLAAIKMGFQSVGGKLNLSNEQEGAFSARVKMLDDAADEARTISHQMMPRVLLEMGLLPALEDMLHKTLGLTEIRYRFEHYGMDALRFPKSIEIGLYRIAQELINNIIKHSGASEVDIQIYKTKSHLILHVEDNGKGFTISEGADQRGIGLSNIFSRASAVNGEVSYEEGQAKGTAANIRVPLA